MKNQWKLAFLGAGALALGGALFASATYPQNGSAAGEPEVSIATGTTTSVVPSTSTPGPLPGNPSAPGNRNPSNPNPSSPEQGDRDGRPSHP